MKLSSPSFKNGGKIPDRFTCTGDDINPELIIDDIPKGTKCLALTCIDPTSPYGNFVHWVEFDIAPNRLISANSVPGTQGMNDFKKLGYGGPCPMSGTHTYIFTAYALDVKLNCPEGADLSQLTKAMKGHIINTAELKGLYAKPPSNI